MSFIRSDVIRKMICVVCLLAFSAAAQQSNTAVSLRPVTSTDAGGAAPAQQSGSSSATQQAGASLPGAPQPQKLPEPLHMDFSKPVALFPNPLARYIPRDVPPPVFTNAPRIGELVQNGKIMLSLNDAIAIALVDNLDIAIARYNLPIADTDILRTKAGASFLGVNTGVVQNTPGGGVGGIGAGVAGAGAGGTTAGAGGAGVGAGGFVGSTAGAGPQPDSFDPVLSGTLSVEHATFPQANVVTTGAPVVQQNTTLGNFTYFQGYSPGTALTVAYDNSRVSSTNRFNTLNPTLNGSFRASLRQHLLQGFGPSLNTRLIRQAKNTRKITEQGFRQQVIVTVSQIEGIYWDLVNAYQDFKVKERSLALAQKTLSDNQKQVEIGTLAPLDVVRAQSTVATAEQDLIISKTSLQLQQLTIKNALTRSLPADSATMQLDVIPTDIVQIPDQENLPPVDELIRMALLNRPDYNQQKINLQNSEINRQGANNALLPVVDVVAFYGASSLAGPFNTLNPGICGNPGAPPAPPGCVPPPAITGFTDTFGNLFNSSAPDKGVLINLQIPLSNRTAQATQIRSRLEYRQSQLLLKQQENKIAIAVRNDEFTVEQARARVAAAQRAQVLAQQVLDAEQKKYNLGASTYLFILQDERDLAQAQSNLVSAMTNYAKARVLLDQDTAQTLDRNNIKLDEAVTGEIRTQPMVPGTVPNKSAIEELTKPAQPQPPNRPPK
jgi:outer membrane protein